MRPCHWCENRGTILIHFNRVYQNRHWNDHIETQRQYLTRRQIGNLTKKRQDNTLRPLFPQEITKFELKQKLLKVFEV